MVIQHNMSSLNALRNTKINNGAASKNIEKLASGIQVNRAGDDAAGLAISEKMRGQIRGLNMAKMNIDHGINLVKTADGGIAEIQDTLQRIRELSVQMTNGTYTDEDRALAQLEVGQLYKNIDLIANTTHFNGIYMLRGHSESASGAAYTADTINVTLYPRSSLPHDETINVFGQTLDLNYVLNGDKVTGTGTIDGISKSITVKLGTNGINEVYGGSREDNVNSMIQTSDGGYLIIGYTYSVDGDILDYDGKDGVINIWNTENYSPTGTAVIEDFDNNSSGNAWIMKIDKYGNKEWSTLFGASYMLNPPEAYQAVELSNGNFAIVVCGENANTLPVDKAVVVIDSNGDYITHNAINNSKGMNYYGAMCLVNDNIVYVQTKRVGATSVTEILVMDGNGNLSQSKELPGYPGMCATTIKKLDDGYVLIGQTSNPAHSQTGQIYGGLDACVLKLDNNFNVVYSKTFGSDDYDNAKDVITTPDGGFIIVGEVNGQISGDITANAGNIGSTFNTDVFAIRFDSNGDVVWQKTYDSVYGNSWDASSGIVALGGETYMLVCHSDEFGGGADPWLITIDGTNGDVVEEKTFGGSDYEYNYNDTLNCNFHQTGGDGNGLFWMASRVGIIDGDIGNENSAIKGGNVWVYTNDTSEDRTFVSIKLDDYIIKKDQNGIPAEWIKFDKCQAIISSDGSTIEEINVIARLIKDPSVFLGEQDIILQVGANQGDTFIIQKSDMRTKTLFKGMNISVNTREAANATIDYVDIVINHVSGERAKFGAYQNALEHIQQNVMNGSENLQSAESSIRDLDMAKEMMGFTKNNILVQAAQSMLAQANQLPQGVLSLLR